ncbi:MAG: hydrolase [Dorea sp.]|nr:hydrolase [Dorea sp.]
MKKFGRIVLVAAFAGTVMVTPVIAAPEVSELEQEKQAAQENVDALKIQLTETIGKISQLEKNLVDKGKEVIQAKEELAEAQETEKRQYEDMKLRIRFLYEQGDRSLLEALMTAESFTDLVNKAEYIQNVHSYDRDKLTDYIEARQNVYALKTALEEEQKSMEAMKADFEAEENNLNEMIAAKQAEVDNIGELLKEALAAVTQKQSAVVPGGAAAGNAGETQSDPSGGGFTNPVYSGTGDSSLAQIIVSTAYSQLNVPYVWGGASPSGFDCSGLVMYCHNAAGVSLDHYSESQGAGGAVSDPQPGDVVYYPGHVGIYIGNGQMIHAPQENDVVKISNVYDVGTPTFVRYW